jgi:hypothetical protein
LGLGPSFTAGPVYAYGRPNTGKHFGMARCLPMLGSLKTSRT